MWMVNREDPFIQGYTHHLHVRRLQRKLQDYFLYEVKSRNYCGVGCYLSGDGGAAVYDDSPAVSVRVPVDYVKSLQEEDANKEEILLNQNMPLYPAC
jgi:hypothetical protein